MSETKEKILQTALRLFARDGYEAVSVSQLAGELGVTKGALYRHFKSKRDIFDQILLHMEAQDAQRAEQFSLPAGALAGNEAEYQSASIAQVIAFSRAQLRYWLEDEFAAPFRRMLSLERYRSDEMRALHANYLVSGPLGYTQDLLASLGYDAPREKALAFYAPMYFLYSLYDAGEPLSHVLALADEHFSRAARALIGDEAKR